MPQVKPPKNKPEDLPVPKRSFWKNPTFLFVCMGILTVAAMIGTYFIAQKYDDPLVAIMSMSGVTGLMILIGGMVIKTIDELETANRIKTEFLSIASHQLKSPLLVIKWSMELLSKIKIDNPEIKDHLNTISITNQRMSKLVSDLLDVSRMESGRMKLKPKSVDIVELCQKIIDEHKILLEQNKVKSDFTHPKKLTLSIDPDRFSLVFENLLSNGIKYTNKKNGYINLSLEQKGKKVLLSVSDNGIGIPTDDQKHIFDKFFRSSNVSSDSGTGLGLFIAKAIVKMHQGEMWFESKENKGTTFFVELPLKSDSK